MSKRFCLECMTEFDGPGRDLICSPECRAIRTKRQQAEEWQRAKKRNKKPPRDPILCPHCKELFVPIRDTQRICTKKECKRLQNIVNASERKNGIDSHSAKIDKRTRAKYDSVIKSEFNINKFTYMKMYKNCLKNLRKGNEQTKDIQTMSRQTRALAMDDLKRIIAEMDPDSERTKLILLERDYIRELEKEKLRLNIKIVLGSDSVEGDYTLNEAGKVLGVSRERARQLENEAGGMLQRPTTARLLRIYTEDIHDQV